VFLETIVTANLLTGTKHPAFSTNHMADTNNTKHDEDQKQYENQNNHIRKQSPVKEAFMPLLYQTRLLLLNKKC